MRWKNRIQLKHLFTEREDHNSVQSSMNAIAETIQAAPFFRGFSATKFRNIPTGDEVIGPVDYANRLLDHMYDFADEHRIWIE